MGMFCDKCGENIDDGSNFCRQCGAQQTTTVGTKSASSTASRVGEPPRSSNSTPKPAGNTGRVIGVVVAILLIVAFITSLGKAPTPTPGIASQDVNVAGNDLDMASDNLAATADQPKPSDAWSYSTDEDKVRGSTTYFATTTSTNTIRQNQPYDSDTSMTITVRKSVANGTDVILTISSGQMMCPSYEGCSGTVRFDDTPAQHINFSGPADSSSETIFVDGAKSFIAKLKKAKKIVIEKTLYQAGSPQFEFDVSGLKWDH